MMRWQMGSQQQQQQQKWTVMLMQGLTMVLHLTLN
jgi:hypothetical protein